ncbi:PE family protein [Candidatus Phaeomarinobacter ectocarpi]|uniref:PE family protein n=1 Tax=Candidatus Phaeomarinibacter ectocarpi TaxID=1458461 RepID=X5MEA6_9HYPH|nr:hypothetical protein [Candidatus Phaeomarinobacter ectocarpi]CDO60802.1 PE family protein [Candidatus Phaeomarinobacter ectocarpi]
MTVQESIDRLKDGYYNSNPVNPDTNPGGMGADGHRDNFPSALVDLGIVGQDAADQAAAAQAVLADPGFVQVLADLDAIVAVAVISAAINIVAGINADVTTVAGDSAEIQALAAITASINTVAGIDANVTTVAGDSAEVQALAAITAAINTVAGIEANVTTVAGDTTEVQALAAITAAINTVAGIEANVTTVAGDSAEVQALAAITAAINTVAGIEAGVSTVAGDSAEVQALAAITAAVNTVAGIDADVTTVAGVSAAVQSVADNLAALADKADDELSNVTPSVGRAALELDELSLNRSIYTASGTFEKADLPPWVTHIEVDVVGATGGGGGGNSAQNSRGYPGAGAGRATRRIAVSALAVSETVTIGSKGLGGANQANGNSGGTTSFGAHLSATGGQGGVTGQASVAASAGSAPGQGIGGDLNLYGMPGGIVWSQTLGAATPGHSPGFGGVPNMNVGSDAALGGAGTGGNHSGVRDGGDGSDGLCIVRW